MDTSPPRLRKPSINGSDIEHYAGIWQNCCISAIEAAIFERSEEENDKIVQTCEEKVALKPTRIVRAGSAKRHVNDMLEYGMRLNTGVDVLKDVPAAYTLFMKVVKGPYADVKRAIAYSLACYFLKLKIVDGGLDGSIILNAFISANRSCELGLFSHCSLQVLMLCDGLGLAMDIAEPYKSHVALWRCYADYREKTGVQRPRGRVCALCGYRPKERTDLKRCAGKCDRLKKSVYCSRECQMRDWPKHKFHCKAGDIEDEKFVHVL